MSGDEVDIVAVAQQYSDVEIEVFFESSEDEHGDERSAKRNNDEEEDASLPVSEAEVRERIERKDRTVTVDDRLRMI